jgi:hypothetical protein
MCAALPEAISTMFVPDAELVIMSGLPLKALKAQGSVTTGGSLQTRRVGV